MDRLKRRPGHRAFIVFVFLVGCQPSGADQLAAGVFVSESIDIDEPQSQLFDGVEVTVEVSHVDDEQWVSWRAGCNTWSAPARRHDGQLELTDEVLSTAMACEAEKNEQDDRLEQFFTGEPRWERDGEVLRLRSDGGTSEILLTEKRSETEK